MDSSSPEMFPHQGGFLRQVRAELDRFLADIDPRLTHRTFLLGVYGSGRVSRELVDEFQSKRITGV